MSDDQINDTRLNELINNLVDNQLIIVKFTAEWCGPCQGIKSLVKEQVKLLPDSVQFYEIDIDESLELYMKLKQKKMVNGIPAILAYKSLEDKEYWYVPDDSVLGANKNNVTDFFTRCIQYSK